LWEVFLVEHLGYGPEQAETLACDLEHAIPAETAERLSAFLGQPQASPQGKPIPRVTANPLPPLGVPLSSLASGTQAQVVALPAQDPPRGFLERAGLQPGERLTVLAVHPGTALLVQTGANPALDLVFSLAQEILVESSQ
jgi:DtxR family Mn-dependent transcriptional regulator